MSNKIRAVVISVAAICIVALAISVVYVTVTIDVKLKDKIGVYRGTMCEISTITGELEKQPKVITTNFKGDSVSFEIDLEDCEVVAFDNYGGHTSLRYTTADQNQCIDIILVEQMPEDIGLTVGEKNKMNYIWNTLKVGVKTDDSNPDLATNIAYSKLSYWGRDGYLVVKAQSIKSEVPEDERINSADIAYSIVDTMVYNKYTAKDVRSNELFIGIDGIGVLDIGELSVLKSGAGIYFGSDNILRLYNYKEDKAYGYIANLDNKYLMNPKENLVKSEEIEGLYYDKDYDNNEKMGYRGFAVETSKGFYYIKADENAPDGFEEELIEWLGFNGGSGN